MAVALVGGIVTFPCLAVMAHAFAHTISLDHSAHVESHHRAETGDHHPDADIQNLPDGTVGRSNSFQLDELTASGPSIQIKEQNLLATREPLLLWRNHSPPERSASFNPHVPHAPPVRI